MSRLGWQAVLPRHLLGLTLVQGAVLVYSISYAEKMGLGLGLARVGSSELYSTRSSSSSSSIISAAGTRNGRGIHGPASNLAPFFFLPNNTTSLFFIYTQRSDAAVATRPAPSYVAADAWAVSALFAYVAVYLVYLECKHYTLACRVCLIRNLSI